VFEGLEDAGIPLHEIYRTRTGVFVAAYTAFLPAADAPDESLLRAQIMSSLADQVKHLTFLNKRDYGDGGKVEGSGRVEGHSAGGKTQGGMRKNPRCEGG
jgi:hypothetical protein